MTLDGTRTFIIGRKRPVVIDPGPADPAHQDTVLAALDGASHVAILVTHDHMDHAGGSAPLAAATGASVHRARFGDGGHDLPHPPLLDDGQQFDTDVGPVRAVATPGHSRDHFAFAFRDPQDGLAMLVGDLMMGQGDTALVAWPHGNIATYLASLERIRAENPSVILPAHGPAISRPGAALDRYRHHRLQRVQQTLARLRDRGPSSAGELVDAVYGDRLDPRLVTHAEASIAAALEYLRERGSVARSDDGRFIADPEPTPAPKAP